jgi:hypothetical protein
LAKANDKKVVMDACQTLLAALGNLLESHRERRFVDSKTKKPLPRKQFCEENNLVVGTVSHIETGRFLGLQHPQLRKYLAVTYGRSDAKFAESMRKVHAGLKEVERFLEEL